MYFESKSTIVSLNLSLGCLGGLVGGVSGVDRRPDAQQVSFVLQQVCLVAQQVSLVAQQVSLVA